MADGHNHPHSHNHGGGANARRLTITLALVVAYMGAEVVGGIVSGSLALIADAGHMLSDAAALGLTLFAMRFARRPATALRTYETYPRRNHCRSRQRSDLGRRGHLHLRGSGTEILESAGGRRHHHAGCRGRRAAGKRCWSPHSARRPWRESQYEGRVAACIDRRTRQCSGNRCRRPDLGLRLAVGRPVASVLIGLLVIYSSWSLIRQSVAVLMEGRTRAY